VDAAVQEHLRYLLNEWDFLGVADFVDDEYDCMIGPLLSLLLRGAGRAELGEYLWRELEGHFGLSDPAPYGTDQMADRVASWWLPQLPNSDRRCPSRSPSTHPPG
jgi:hypothetical protein